MLLENQAHHLENRAHQLKKHFNLKIHYVIERVDRRIDRILTWVKKILKFLYEQFFTGTPRKENTGRAPGRANPNTTRGQGTASGLGTATAPSATSRKSSSGHVSRRVVRPTGKPPVTSYNPTGKPPVTTGKLTRKNFGGGKKTKRIRRGSGHDITRKKLLDHCEKLRVILPRKSN